jgi:hypothetical protein
MKHQNNLLALALLVSASTIGTAQASLIDRGNGLLYDDVLNVTWLQDANYAKTSGASTSGLMDWATATAWAANLNFDGLSGWRLATNTPVSGGSSFNPGYQVNGSSDFGYNITSPNSELAYMYNVNLGLKDYYSTNFIYQPTYGIFGNGTGTIYDQANIGLVQNLRSFSYWSGAENSAAGHTAGNPGIAWYFDASTGLQTSQFENAAFFAWAVHPGDVSAVPVPSAVWLFGSGLLGLLGFKRRGNSG